MNRKEPDFILQEGGGLKIEFKESMSNIDKEMVAFANSEGGRIFLGVGDDNKAVGIGISNALKSQIQDIARNCDPPVGIKVESKGTDKTYIIDRKDFTADIYSNYSEAMTYLHKNLKLIYRIEGFGPRKEILEIPDEALKEALVNAMAHRDYSEKGASILVEIFDDRVEISNPGGLIIKEEEFGKRSLSRNPLVFDLLQRLELVEKVGSGINRIKDAMTKAKLREPEFEFGKFFSVAFSRPTIEEAGMIAGKPEGLNEGLNEGLRLTLNAIANHPNIKAKDIAALTKRPVKTIERHIKQLVSLGKVERRGSRKTGGYWEAASKKGGSKP